MLLKAEEPGETMEVNTLFDRPIQTIGAISKAVGISRFTLVQACQHGLFGVDAYKSEGTWLIDTQGHGFRAWLEAYPTQRRVRGRIARQEEKGQMTRGPQGSTLTVGEALQQLVAAVVEVSDLPDPVSVQVGFVQCSKALADYICLDYSQVIASENEVRLGTLLTVLLLSLHDPFFSKRFRLRCKPAQTAIDQALAALEAAGPSSETAERDSVGKMRPHLVQPPSQTGQLVLSKESQYLQISKYDLAMDSMVALDGQGNTYVIDSTAYQQAFGFYQEHTGQGERAFQTSYWTPTMPDVHPLINEQQDAPQHLCESCRERPAAVYRNVILEDVGYYWLCRSCYQTLAA